MTFDELMATPQQLLLKSLSGSRAYNLQVPTSDTDLKGIFILPEKELYGLQYTPQVNNASNDEVYFEIGRFMELLCKNNPNILELLSTTEQSVLYKHPLMALVKPEDFLSKLCLQTFAGYAKTQIKKAGGLNKMINRPMDGPRKTVADFCYVIAGTGSVPLAAWLRGNGITQEACGLMKIDHFRDVYLVFHQQQLPAGEYFRGIISGEDADDVQLSSIPKDLQPLAVMNFNKDGYSVYCREYGAYKQWVEERNPARYESTMHHGKGYDAKNMMHTVRLLSMAEEIALHHQVNVYRSDRDFLLKIRRGEFEYEELMKMVEDKMNNIEELYARADLPDAPDERKAEDLLVQIRSTFYER